MNKPFKIQGVENGHRLESRILEERVQHAVSAGHRVLEIEAFGQHGLGGRLWSAGDEQVEVKISGAPGQRVGSMGFPNTRIEVLGNASDDVGWLNAGAEIVVHGHAGNGVANAMAQGKVMVAGNIGARGMTMTKRNPRFAPPELWVLGSVGDYFAEFMAGGIAVICGHEPQDPGNVLGYRPCVGMVGGRIFFRGQENGFSQKDAKEVALSDEDWEWLTSNLQLFLQRIGRADLLDKLSQRKDWRLLVARSPVEKKALPRRAMGEFRNKIWEAELGQGGLIGDLSNDDRSPIPLIVSGDLRRFIPVWENDRYLPPCEAACPTGIPVQKRWQLIREDRLQEAIDLIFNFTPLPATVCGYLCPNLCMQSCTRQLQGLLPVDVRKLGQVSAQAKLPKLPKLSGKKVAVVGGGPAGMSVAWQLRLRGHQAVIYDDQPGLGGKIRAAIPRSRIPSSVLDGELAKMEELLSHEQVAVVDKDFITALKSDYDFIVLAVGASKPRVLPVPGREYLITALDFLKECQQGKAKVGRQVVIIGAGNVGCDVATEAHRFGAQEITLIDIQKPASFGKEREAAEQIGAKFRWPVFTKEVTDQGVVLTSGELLPAQTVIISVGDQPELSFLPETVRLERGFIEVDENFQTADPKIFAIGDVVRLGLITEAVGAGRRVAQVLDEIFAGHRPRGDKRVMIDRTRIKLEYFDPRKVEHGQVKECAEDCVSCARCRDCGLCIAICPQGAISRHELAEGSFELQVDGDKCIGCGFCVGACPCGIWTLQANEELV